MDVNHSILMMIVLPEMENGLKKNSFFFVEKFFGDEVSWENNEYNSRTVFTSEIIYNWFSYQAIPNLILELENKKKAVWWNLWCFLCKYKIIGVSEWLLHFRFHFALSLWFFRNTLLK